MKKKLFLIGIFLLMILPINAKAYGIENYFINATIESDGDLLVEEYFNMTGSYNGFERIINYKNSNAYSFDPNSYSYGGSKLHNGDNLEILEVRGVPVNSNFNFNNIGGDVFDKVSSASKGDYGVYTVDYSSDGRSVLIYNPSSYDNAFYIKYRISNIAIRHNDVGELGWNLVGNQLTESVGTLRAYINIPGNTNVKAWAHGPLNGKVEIINPNKVLVSINGLYSNQAVDVRTTFDLDVIKDSNKLSNVEALNKILLYEEDKANQANYEREQKDKMNIYYAEQALAQFEVNITRSNYDNAKYCISNVYDEEVKARFLERLEATKIELDKIEEKKARDDILYAYDNLTYKNYINAVESVSILDNEEVKLELEKELDKILDLLKEAEKKLEIKNYTLGSILFIITGVLGYFIYKLYRKDPMTNFNHQYFRDIPSDISPETVSYLFSKKISNKALSASMIELVRKKIITVEKISGKNYRLSRDYNYTNLTPAESKLLELIFHGNDSVETKKMNSYAKKNYDAYISNWNDYHDSAKKLARSYNYYESDVVNNKMEDSKISDLLNPKILLILFVFFVFAPHIVFPIFIIYILFIFIRNIFRKIVKGVFDVRKVFFTIGLIIIGFISFIKMLLIMTTQHFYISSILLFILLVVGSIIFIVMLFNKKKRTLEGAEEYNKWKALNNFLNDFGRFQDKEAISVVLWEKYLVFATLFGCAETILKYMKLAMPEDPNGYVSTYTDLYYTNKYISDTVISSHSSAQSAYSAAHSSSSSSGGGGGGGFSSGGGSFGGGGGGGRF